MHSESRKIYLAREKKKKYFFTSPHPNWPTSDSNCLNENIEMSVFQTCYNHGMLGPLKQCGLSNHKRFKEREIKTFQMTYK